jgi:Flp pilus assembly protein CpaB
LTTATHTAPAASRGLAPTEARTPRTVTFEVTEKQAERLTVASQLGRLQLSVRPLELAPATTGRGEAGPTWAADVSPALNELTRRRPQGGSGIESAIRRPPPTSSQP